MRLYISIIFTITLYTSLAQEVYTDYIGRGHHQGITVSASSAELGTDPMSTINASGMNAELMDVARFLLQSTMGFDSTDVAQVHEMGYEAWIDDQLNKTPVMLEPTVETVWKDIKIMSALNGFDTVDIFGPYQLHFNYAYWQNIMTQEDLLYQRAAWALTQIFVVSNNSDLRDYAEVAANYYDLIKRNAFGNYRDLIEGITKHIAMGYYLSHLNNPRENPALNIHPDENYAREIMQLFSIGLFELNLDGSEKIDANGNPIPTYDNGDIKELAKVFTGLGPGGINEYVWWTDEPYFGLELWGADYRVPMKMFEEYHEPSEKTLLKSLTVPADQPGMIDIEMALDTLYNHPNVGPFLSYRLIQRIIKSNPSPGYVERVATVFNNNGNGVRGDLGAVFKAILLDPEARDCGPSQEFDASRLIEPMILHIHASKALNVYQEQNRYYFNGYDFNGNLKQFLLAAPSVFNFYLPNHKPVGELANNDLVAPELKLHNASTSIQYLNRMSTFSWGTPWWDWFPDYDDNGEMLPFPIEPPLLPYDDLITYEQNADDLIDKLDIILMRGETSDRLRNDLREAIHEFQDRAWFDPMYTVIWTMQMMLVDPDFTVTR